MSSDRKVWVLEVQYTPAGDGRRRPWMRSGAMTFSEARDKIGEYERMGHKTRIACLSQEPAG